MNLVRTTAPTTEPLTLQEVKDHLRLSGTAEDALLAGYLLAATDLVELQTLRSLITQTWTLTLDDWPAGGIFWLPRPPLASVTSIKYLDTDGVQQTWSSSNYRVSTGNEPGRITLGYNATLPSLYGVSDQVEVIYTAGYGANGEFVPMPILQAMLLLIGHFYENREASVIGTIASTMPFSVEALLNPYRVHWVW